MKAILEFNLEEPFEQQAHRRAIKSTDAYLAIMAIRDEVFRPHRKHGYADTGLQAHFTEDSTSSAAYYVTEKLEEMFFDILNEYGIDLDKDIS